MSAHVVVLAEARLALMRAASRRPITYSPDYTQRLAADELIQSVVEDDIFEDFDGMDDSTFQAKRLYALDRMNSL